MRPALRLRSGAEPPAPDAPAARRGHLIPLVIDSDNALGSPRGDVDDGFAVAALLRSGLPVTAVASVYGNTPEALARRNHERLAALCGYAGPILTGAGAPLPRDDAAPLTEAAQFFVEAAGPWRVVALGPLTNLAAALAAAAIVAERVAEVVCVGSNGTSGGRWPPWWPHEFNLTRDRRATRLVFESRMPLTIVPLDVARRLRVTPADLAALPGPLGEDLRRHSRRWLWRAALLRGRRAFPVWDLVAALWTLEPRLFESASVTARLHRNGWLEHGAGTRPITVVRAFEPRALWRRFVDLLADERAGQAPAGSPRGARYTGSARDDV